jgi:hypothetical protein
MREGVVGTAQGLLRDCLDCLGCSGELGKGEGEPRVISAWVEAASLLTDLRTKKKKVVFNYQQSVCPFPLSEEDLVIRGWEAEVLDLCRFDHNIQSKRGSGLALAIGATQQITMRGAQRS